MVLLSGVIYTARDAAHKKMTEQLAAGGQLPFELKDAVIYYVGPTPARPGHVIGSAGPTTSGRMDAYAPTLLDLGLKGMIGKGAHPSSGGSHPAERRCLFRRHRRGGRRHGPLHQERRSHRL